MTDELNKVGGTPAGETAGETTGEQQSGGAPQSVPYERLQAVIKERNALKKQIEDAEKAQAAAEKERLAEAGKYKELYEQAQADKSNAETRLAEIERERQRERREMALRTAAAQHKPPVLPDAIEDLVRLASLDVLEESDLLGSAAVQVGELLKTRQHWLNTGRQGAGSPVGPQPSGGNAGTEAQREAFARTIRNQMR